MTTTVRAPTAPTAPIAPATAGPIGMTTAQPAHATVHGMQVGSIDARRRRRRHAAMALLVALTLGGPVLLAGQQATAAPCTTTVAVILAHPDDAIAFMHDNVRWQAQLGNCVHLVSLTSYYDYSGPIPDRENGARAAYQLLTDAGAPDDTPQNYATAVAETFGSMTGYRMFVHGSTNLTLTFFRQPPSTYPSNTPGALYDRRNDPNLIGAVSAFLGRYRPQKVYTLDTAGTLLLNGQQNCTTQDGGMIGSNECDHYDHVGSAILARQAVTASGIATTVHEFRGYAMGAGKPVTFRDNCGNFCAMLNAYLVHDVDAEGTPWGPFLTTADQPVRSYTTAPPPTTAPTTPPVTGTFSNRPIRSALSSTACIGPAGGATTNGTRIVTLTSCTGAPGFTLASSGQLQVAGKCVESGSGTTSADVVITLCTGAAHQRWSRDATSGVFTQLHSGLKLDLFNSGTTAGNKVITFPGTGNNNQRWVLL